MTGIQACQVMGMIQKKSYPPKSVLFHEGSATHSLFLLKSGYVKLTSALPDGRNQGLRFASSWQFVGLDALGDDQYSYTAEAITPIDVCTIRHKDMLILLEQNPRLALSIINTLNRELQHANNMIKNLGMMSSTERVAAFLLSILQSEEEGASEFPLPLSRTDMAEMLGLTLETVSRVLSRLTREKIIWMQPSGRLLRIIDKKQLEALGGDISHDIWPRAVKHAHGLASAEALLSPSLSSERLR
jgi:CRP/FNR family transcriptional regulator